MKYQIENKLKNWKKIENYKLRFPLFLPKNSCTVFRVGEGALSDRFS